MISLKMNNSYMLFVALLNLYFLPYSNGVGPGKAACLVYGNQDNDCNQPLIPIDKLPSECSSIFFDGFTIDPVDGIFNAYGGYDAYAITQRILKETTKPVFLYVGHLNFQKWDEALDTDGKNAETEAGYMSKFLNDFNCDLISGIVFDYLSEDLECRPNPEFSVKLQKYLSVFKTKFPKLQFGLDISAKTLMEFSDSPLLDFSCITPLIDFYSLHFMSYNPCNKNTCGGTVPIQKQGNLNSLDELVQEVIPKMCIPKEKIWLSIFLNTHEQKSKNKKLPCETTFQDICTKPDAHPVVCADSACTFQQKGNITREFGGFIGGYVDLNDPNGCCQCGKSFPSFYYVLDGQSGNLNCPKCALFDRTS